MENGHRLGQNKNKKENLANLLRQKGFKLIGV